MLWRASGSGSPLTISLGTGSLTAGLDGGAQVAASDRAGRLYSYFRDGHTFRRGLNGRILHKWRDAGGRGREVLPEADAGDVVDSAASLFGLVLDALQDPSWRWMPPVDPGLKASLLDAVRLAAAFDRRSAREDAARFASVYRPVGILPPDQYLALVLQATEGCSFGTCTFCDLYKDRYRVRPAADFRRHVAAVRDYMGASLSLRRTIFLGAANALAVPMATLVPIFETLALELPEMPVYAFVDAFTGTRKDENHYRVLGRLGLRRVYIGLESGNDQLLDFVRKPGSARDAVGTVRAIKKAGLSVGVIVIAGLGGERFAVAHVRDTVRALNEMRLGGGDVLYISDLVEEPAASYPSMARLAGIGSLPPDAIRAQREHLRAGLSFDADPPRIATYDIREFVY